MREYYKDYCYSGIYSSRVMHSIGVSGKISGAINVIGEIRDAIPIIHSPKGCGFHYKFNARRRYLPAYETQCTDLKEKDIIFGTEKKLEETILDTIDKYHPKLIAVIPSICTDIINADINSVIDKLGTLSSCKVISIKSSVFSHIDKSTLKKNNKERILYWDKPEKQNGIGKGCGIDEAMTAIVEQVMKPQEKENKSVNIESFAWGHGGNETLKGVKSILSELGIKVNTVMPSCKTEDLILAPRASLNITRRVAWAKTMKNIFGTEYFHLNSFNPYHGLDGIEKFYLNIADIFSMRVEANKILGNMKQEVFEEIKEVKSYMKNYTFALYSDSYSSLPYIIETLTNDYGIKLKYICINVDSQQLQYEEIGRELEAKILSNVKKAVNATETGSTILVNCKRNELKEAFKEVDMVINGTKLLNTFKDLKTIDIGNLFTTVDFNNFKNNVIGFADRVKKSKSYKNLIISKFDYDSVLYPTINDINPVASEKMWHKMWTLRGKG